MLSPSPARYATRLSVIAMVLTAVACSSSGVSPVPSDGKLPLGTWGGDDAGMIVGDTAMHLHVGCTYGDVSGRVVVDANGRFDVTGSYLLRAYPIAVGPTMPARFVGRVEGSVTTVTVTVNDTVQHATIVKGPVVVEFGEAPRLGPCPICRRPVLTHGGA
ncbi:MAG: hypothetical protein ABIT20_16445 [Gemmatimonadaceae bacterium]